MDIAGLNVDLAALADAMTNDPGGLVPAPLTPPGEWFERPADWWDPEGPLVQIDFTTGRVTALVAPYGECILDGRSGCWSPPVSATNYEYAHVGSMLTADGNIVRVANIGGNVNHFDPYQATAASLAADHYANTATRRMVGRYMDIPPHGIVFCGSMYPQTSFVDAVECMTSALSGDWRWIESMRDYEFVGAQLVNNPGFRPNRLNRARLAALVPTRLSSSVSFFDIGAHVASASCSGTDTVRSFWSEPEVCVKNEVAAKLAGLEPVAAMVLLKSVPDVELEDVFDGVDYSDELVDLDGECEACAGHGCAECGDLGYSDGPLMAHVARLRRKPDRPRDGDGDGFVYDSTPRERPYNPLTDLVGKAIDLVEIKRAAAGDGVYRKRVLDRAVKNLALSRNRASMEQLVESTLGERPKRDGRAQWDVMSDAIHRLFGATPNRGAPDAPEAPKVDALEAPKVDAPEVKAPKVDAPEVKAPKVDAPEVDVPEAMDPATHTPTGATQKDPLEPPVLTFARQPTTIREFQEREAAQARAEAEWEAGLPRSQKKERAKRIFDDEQELQRQLNGRRSRGGDPSIWLEDGTRDRSQKINWWASSAYDSRYDTSGPIPDLSDEVNGRAVAAEPHVTAVLMDVVPEGGGILVGLQHKLKEPLSLDRKIKKKAPAKGHRAAADSIQDALRYTAVFDEGSYAESVRRTMDRLIAEGHTPISVENTWARGDDYSGINTNFYTPDGFPYELQFHTPSSYINKDAIHGDYEIARDPSKPVDERTDAYLRMVETWDQIGQPEGWEQIGELITKDPDDNVRYMRAADAGLSFDPYSEAAVADVRAADKRGEIPWGEVPETTIPHDQIPSISANEAELQRIPIRRVTTGREKFRDGYTVKLMRDEDGRLHIVDGHHRVAMYSLMGRDLPVQIVDRGAADDVTLRRKAKQREAFDGLGAAVGLDTSSISLDGSPPKPTNAVVVDPRTGAMSTADEWAFDAADVMADRETFIAGAARLPSVEKPNERLEAIHGLYGRAGKKSSTKVWHDSRGDSGEEYTPERSAIHEAIVEEIVMRSTAAGVPRDQWAVFSGGLSGSGKSFALRPGQSAGDLGVVAWDLRGDPPEGVTHVAIDPDWVKERMAELGLTPEIPGLKPMETSSLVHGESSDIAGLLQDRLTEMGFNVVFDGTMGDEKRVREQLRLIDSKGYPKPDLVAADITTDESRVSVDARYASQVATDLGGRPVPRTVQGESKVGRSSAARDTIDNLTMEGAFDSVIVVDNRGVANSNAVSLDDVNNGFPLPAWKAAELKGSMSDEEFDAALRVRGIKVGETFGTVTARAEGGRWTVYDGEVNLEVGPGGYPARSVEKALALPGVGGGEGSKESPFVVNDVETAAILLAEGEYHIQLDTPRQVSTTLDKLAAMVEDARNAGRNPPNYDLCKVTVPGTNLFCAETKGYPRIQMPQLSTPTPVPGSFADSLPRHPIYGDVNLVSAFLGFLRDSGYTVTEKDVMARDLKASQAELNGSKVVRNIAGRRADLARDPNSPARPIIVTSDGYIVDGHHGWATQVALSYADGVDVVQPVQEIDASILDILPLAVKWSTEAGSPTQGLAMPGGGSARVDPDAAAKAQKLAKRREQRRIRRGRGGGGVSADTVAGPAAPGATAPTAPGAGVPSSPGVTPVVPVGGEGVTPVLPADAGGGAGGAVVASLQRVEQARRGRGVPAHGVLFTGSRRPCYRC